jgi:hypothetical protein
VAQENLLPPDVEFRMMGIQNDWLTNQNIILSRQVELHEKELVMLWAGLTLVTIYVIISSRKKVTDGKD